MNNPRLFSMLRSSAIADRERALLSLELLAEHPAGIGDHSTSDFYNNAEEALRLLGDANDRLETLDRHFPAAEQAPSEPRVRRGEAGARSPSFTMRSASSSPATAGS